MAECIHVHDDACGYNEEAGDASCAHVCSEEYGCFKLVPDCRHAHDESCGYVEATPEQPCTYSCTECAEPGEDPSEPEEDPSEPEVDEAVEAVRALIEALPTLEEIKAMSTQEQSEVYTQVQKAYDAYDALTDDQKAQLPEAEGIFAPLFDYFNSLVTAIWDGAGSASSPYLINNEEDLRALAQSTYDGDTQANTYFALTGNITLTEAWTPIGTDATKFMGIFNGQGYTISGISGTGSYLGLFAYLGGGARVENVNVAAVDLSGGQYLAGIAAVADHTGGQIVIRNCHALSGTISGIDSDDTGVHYLAGIVGSGYANGGTGLVIEKCTNSVYINAEDNSDSSGGIAGYVNSATITSCINYANVYGNAYSEENGSSYLGGICGKASGSTFAGCANYGAISTFYAHGIAGGSGNRFSNCLNGGTLTHSSDGYGVPIGRSLNSRFENCYFSKVGYQGGMLWEDPSKTGTKVGSLSGGDVAYLMGNYFGQVIGTDPYPVLLTASNKVHKVTITGELEKTLYVTHNRQMSLTLEDPNLKLFLNDAEFSLSTPITEDLALTSKTVISVIASGECGNQGDNLTWQLTDDGVLTISGTGAMSDYGSSDTPWVDYRDRIKSVVLESGVNQIGKYAFSDCSNLTDVTIPEGVTGIAAYAFNRCTGLKSISIPDTVTSIGDSAFYKCSSLTGLTIPEGVTHIGASAFRSCTSLADVTVANSVISIGSLAFADCTNLTGIALPGGLRTLGSNPFKGCTQITSFTISESNSSFCSVDGVLFNEACTRILAVPGGISGSYSIPDGVTSIDSYAFSGCSSLTGVTIPDSVTSIDSYAFSGCSSLTGVTIPSGVTGIGSYAFSGCSSLTSIIIPSSVTSIYGYAFGDCGSLTSITFSGDAPTIYDPAFKNVTATVYYPADNSTWTGIPTAYGGTLTWKTYGTVASGTCGDNLTWMLTDYGVLIISGTGAMRDYESLNAPWYAYRSSIQKIVMNSGLTYIGARAFQYCSNLTDVTIPESVTGIGSFAFASCHSLTGITLPSELTTLGSNPFGNCNLLTSITIPETNASFRSVDGVLFNKACTEILSVPSGKSGSYSIPESVTGIGSSAFVGCKNLTDVIIPEGVTSIANAAFNYCSGLAGITIPEGVTGIGQYVFDGCSGLTDITIPSSVTSIDKCAFGNCSSLTSITFSGDAPTIYYNAFTNVTATVYYPNGNTTWENVAGKSYSGTLTWETYGPASEVASGTCGDNLTWVLTSDGVLTINGTGDMFDYSSVSSTPWYSHRSSITSLVVSEGVTSIGSNAFRGSGLESVSFGNASLTLGNYSFAYCESLKSIDFGTGTIQPGEYVFAGCTALTSVHVPQNVVMNGSYNGIGSGKAMFTSCSNLQTATVDCGYVGPFFFESCYGMTQATFTNPNVRFYYLENNDSHPFNAGSQAMNVNVVGCLCSQVNVLVQKGQRSDITLTFSQIAGDTTQHTEKVLPGTATCTAAGLSEGKVCSVCGYVIEKQTNVDALGHDLQSHDGKAATCLKTGWAAYETCSRCDYTTYQEIPLASHTEKTVPGYAASCDKDGLTDGTVCSVCGAVLVEQKVIPAAHTLFKVEGKDATCTEDGVIAHYRCKVCGRKFADESAKTELSNTVIPAGHQFNGNHQCTLCGKIGGEWGDQGTWELVDGCLTIQGAAKFDQLCPALSDAPWGIYSEDIRKIVIGNNVGICENAFANLANLEAVTIAAIDGIRDNAFAGCGKLNSITFTEDVPFAISQTAFTGVTATAHYNVKYNTRLYINLQNYGGSLTWVEHGENAKRISISHYGSSGGIGSFRVQTFPNTTTADCEFTLSQEGIIELTSEFFRGASYKELSPGEVTVTALDKLTGLTASFTILVPDTNPKDIECPYEENILIDGYIVRREYRFTPKTTGYYVGYTSYMGEAGGFSVALGDSWVDRSSTQCVSGGEYGVYYLTAGETYSIFLECDSGQYGSNITFRWDAADTQITSIYFEEETLQYDLTPGTEGQFAWEHVCVAPGECSDPITWSIGDSDVAEIQSSDGYNCSLTLKNVGTTTLTASCGGKSASVPLQVHAPAELKLNQTAQVTAYENTADRLIQFTAEETAQYVFTVQDASSVFIDGRRQDPNGYGADGETYFAKVSAGQTLVLRLTLQEGTTATVSAAKAESTPTSIELICLSNTQREVSFGVRFTPATSTDEIVSWEISDPNLLGESTFTALNSSRKYYIPYAKGEVTVTATSASGLTASCTLTVGRCFDGHTNVPQVIAATCTTGGFTINTCSVCGEKTITARVNALGHGLTHHDAQAATCSEIGWEAYDTCSRCDYTTYEEIPATGHTFSHVNSAPATCTEEGVKEHYHCSVCGKDFEDENGTRELSTVSIPAASHTEETIPGKAATCTETGLTDGKKCSVCGEILEAQQTIPASHNFVDGVCSKCGAITGICGANGDNLTYVLTTDGKLTISGSGKMADYSESSPAPWYSERARITSVVLTDGVTSIGYSAFFGCSSLTSVTIPEGVTTIGGGAFENCSGLTSVTIPDGVSSIGYSAFENCSGLTSVTIPDGVSSIENGTFSGCSGLTSVTIPDSVSSIGERAFKDCSSLTSVTIPDSVSSIGSYAFYGCSSLTSVTIPDSVSSIGASTFRGCSGLTSVTIPDSVSSIGSSAFEGCSSLTSVTIPDSVSSIGSYAFYGCSSLTSVTIPEGVTAIRSSAFSGCSKLTSVTIPDGVTSIESGTFSGCSGLTSVTIPKGVTAIGNNAFYKCSSLTSVTIPDGVTSIESGTFHSCSSLTSVTIPKSVTSIGDQAFYSCSSLTNLTIPDSVTSIGGSAFHSCSSLTSVTIPKGVSSIEYLTFCGCSSLTSVTISEGVSSIERGSFSGCSSLTTVQFLGDGFTGADNIFMYPVTAYYPHGNTTWTQEIRDSFTSRVTWKEACIGALEHTEITDEAKAPTCTETGLTEGSHCSVCGTVLVAQEEISATGHTLTMVEGKEATCTEAGVKAHYHCSVCDKDFEDEDGTTELTDTSIPAEGHSLAKVERVEPTCTEDGVKAHYHCSVCDKNFEDENGTKEMTDTSIPTVEHEWGAWEVTTPATPEAEGVETRKCASCQQEETRPLAYTGNRVELAGTGLENEQVVWIDGVAVPVQKDGSGNSYVTLPENSSSILVTYSFNTGSGDRHTQYPTGMKVYRVEKTDSGLTVAHLPELDNLLQYSGCSIRIVGVKGIRMITSISKSTRSALMGDGLAGYKLVEYGTALCRASALEGGAPMVLGTPGVKSNYAYKRGVADPIFKDTGSLIQYTNVLVGFTDEDCKEDIAMRPYIILEDEKGETVTLYGGTVYRSIGYIAYQNRSAFAPGTAAYDYVWNIIHYVYGDQYDADYKG